MSRSKSILALLNSTINPRHFWDEEAQAWACIECDTYCTADEPCDCCGEAEF